MNKDYKILQNTYPRTQQRPQPRTPLAGPVCTHNYVTRNHHDSSLSPFCQAELKCRLEMALPRKWETCKYTCELPNPMTPNICLTQQLSFLKHSPPWPFRWHLTEEVLKGQLFTDTTRGFQVWPPHNHLQVKLSSVISQSKAGSSVCQSCKLHLGRGTQLCSVLPLTSSKLIKPQQLEFNCQFCWWSSRKIRNYFRAYGCVGPNKC